MGSIFKKFQFWLPLVYLLIIFVDVRFNLTDYQILAMLTSPPVWFNSFQSLDTLGTAILISTCLWFLVGFVIDLLIKIIKSKKKSKTQLKSNLKISLKSIPKKKAKK